MKCFIEICNKDATRFYDGINYCRKHYNEQIKNDKLLGIDQNLATNSDDSDDDSDKEIKDILANISPNNKSKKVKNASHKRKFDDIDEDNISNIDTDSLDINFNVDDLSKSVSEICGTPKQKKRKLNQSIRCNYGTCGKHALYGHDIAIRCKSHKIINMKYIGNNLCKYHGCMKLGKKISDTKPYCKKHYRTAHAINMIKSNSLESHSSIQDNKTLKAKILKQSQTIKTLQKRIKFLQSTVQKLLNPSEDK